MADDVNQFVNFRGIEPLNLPAYPILNSLILRVWGFSAEELRLLYIVVNQYSNYCQETEVNNSTKDFSGASA